DGLCFHGSATGLTPRCPRDGEGPDLDQGHRDGAWFCAVPRLSSARGRAGCGAVERGRCGCSRKDSHFRIRLARCHAQPSPRNYPKSMVSEQEHERFIRRLGCRGCLRNGPYERWIGWWCFNPCSSCVLWCCGTPAILWASSTVAARNRI